MERSKTYLANLLFTIFYKYESKPSEIAETISASIREALFYLFPAGKFNSSTGKLRGQWGKDFLSHLIACLQSLCDEIDCKEDKL
jgi:hypothetical protein